MKRLREWTLIWRFSCICPSQPAPIFQNWELSPACVGPGPALTGAFFGAGIMICWLLQSSRSRNSKALDSKIQHLRTYMRKQWWHLRIFWDMMIGYDRYIRYIISNKIISANALYFLISVGSGIWWIYHPLLSWFPLVACLLLPRY